MLFCSSVHFIYLKKFPPDMQKLVISCIFDMSCIFDVAVSLIRLKQRHTASLRDLNLVTAMGVFHPLYRMYESYMPSPCLRRVDTPLARAITGHSIIPFPVGGRLCNRHRSIIRHYSRNDHREGAYSQFSKLATGRGLRGAQIL